MAAARARASVILRDCDRAAEYAVEFLTDVVVLTAGFGVAVVDRVVLARGLVVAAVASVELTPIPTRLTSAKRVQKAVFLFTRFAPV
jgi:hypothetical protein